MGVGVFVHLTHVHNELQDLERVPFVTDIK